MQATTAAAPTPQPAPAPDLAPAIPGLPTVTFTGADGVTQVLTVPMSRQALRQLRSQREEISSQLSNVTSRRRNVADELSKTTDPAARTGLEQRLGVLDKRIAQMESDLASTGRQLSAVPPGLSSGTNDPNGRDMPPNVMRVTGVFTVFVLFPIAIAISRFIWRRTGRTPVQSMQLSPQIDQRLERLEQGIDAIAIEIERVTEGQRFVTKLLSEQESRQKLPVSSS
jgi:chaperonin cofactor prefoldin